MADFYCQYGQNEGVLIVSFSGFGDYSFKRNSRSRLPSFAE